MAEGGALSCPMLSDQVYQNHFLCSDKISGQRRTVPEESMKEEPSGTYYAGLAPGTERGRSISGLEGNTNIKKRKKSVGVRGTRGRPRGVVLHLRYCSLGSSVGGSPASPGTSSRCMPAISSCYAIVHCCHGCSGLCTGMGLSGVLGDWAGKMTSWLRLKPAKTQITQEVQKAGGGGENRKDKPVPALPPNSTAFYTQIKFEAQRSC